MTVTGQLVEKAGAIDFATLGDDVIEMATHVCLDGLGVTLAGLTEPLGVGRITTRYVREMGGTAQASVFGAGFKTSIPSAAFANGTMAHALDFDNTWYPLNHPTSPTLPTIMAIAEAHELTGRDVITAIVAAFEVQGRLRLACTGLHTGRGFHKPGMTGIMGATAAAAKLLRLTSQESLMAFGLAGSRAGSLAKNTGTMTKSSHAGHAARMGAECGILAGMGWTANDDIFGPGGFFDTFLGDDYDAALLVDGFGDPFRMVDPGVGFKKFPCNYFTHRGIEAAIRIRNRRPVAPPDIRRIEIRFPRFEYVDRPRPASGLDGKFSVQYTALVALLDGKVGIDSFTDERRFADDVEGLLERVELVFDDTISADFQDTQVTVTVQFEDGERLQETVARLSGMHGFPLSAQERMDKFLMCSERVMDSATAMRVAAIVDDLPSVEDLTELFVLLRGPGEA